MTWKIVLYPNFDSAKTSGTYKVVEIDYPTRESASASEQGIAAGGRRWGKVMQSQDVAAYIAELSSARLVAAA